MHIKLEVKICKGCGLPKTITNKSKCLCLICNLKRLAKLSYARKKKQVEKGDRINPMKLNTFFALFWASHTKKVCFESGEPIYNYTKSNCHHLLEKSKYPQFALINENCVLLTWAQHNLWHSLTEEKRAEQMPNTYQRYLQIKDKYLKN